MLPYRHSQPSRFLTTVSTPEEHSIWLKRYKITAWEERFLLSNTIYVFMGLIVGTHYIRYSIQRSECTGSTAASWRLKAQSDQYCRCEWTGWPTIVNENLFAGKHNPLNILQGFSSPWPNVDLWMLSLCSHVISKPTQRRWVISKEFSVRRRVIIMIADLDFILLLSHLLIPRCIFERGFTDA